MPYNGGKDKLHRERHFASGANYRVRTGHEGVRYHRHEIREINAPWLLKADDEHTFVRARNVTRDERIRRIDGRDTLEIDMRMHELWADADLIHVVRHAT